MTQPFTQPEEFEVADAKKTIKSTLFATGCLVIAAGLLIWFLLAAVIGMAGIDAPTNQLLAGAITLAMVGLIVWFRVMHLKRQISRTKLVVNATGVRQHDEWGNVRILNWSDVIAADPVKPPQKEAKMVAGNDIAKAVGEGAINTLSAAAQLLGSAIGLVGYGTIDLQGSNSESTRKAYAKAFGTGPDGRPLVGIALSIFDPNWHQGRIGEWVGRYRPDILEQARIRIESKGKQLGDETGPREPEK